MRTIIDLPEEQVRGLAELCARERISRAEAIRRAVNILLEERKGERTRQALAAGFGAWAPRDFDAREYVEGVRGEWDERDSRLGL